MSIDKGDDDFAFAQIGPVINCTNCLFSDMVPQFGPDGAPLIGQDQLVCMFAPPQLIVIQLPSPEGVHVSIRSQFPAVGPAVCCHQHEPDPADFDMLTGDPMKAAN